MTGSGQTLFVVAVGGSLGAVARFTLSNWFNRVLVFHQSVHVGTALVNIIGSLIMGLVYVYVVERAIWHPQLRGLVMVGLLGSFTTFSSFSLEAINFFERGHPWLSLAYVFGSVSLSIAAAVAGITIGRLLLA